MSLVASERAEKMLETQETKTQEASSCESPSSSPATEPTESDVLLGLTEKAAEKVREIRTAEGIEDAMGLRLRVVGGGCSGFSYDLYFDSSQDGDKTFESNGVRIVVDQMSLM